MIEEEKNELSHNIKEADVVNKSTSEIKVSVIIPVYKVEKYIERFLDSLLGQTLKEIEFIFIDDCGGDGSIGIVEEKAANDDRIKIIYNEKNIGEGASRNKGIEAARGAYLGFVDPDDTFDLNFYEKLYSLAEKYDSDVAKGLRINILPDGTEQEGLLTERLVEFGEFAERKDWFAYFSSEHTTAIYRHALIKKENIRYSETIVAADTLFLLKMMYHAQKVAFCRDVYYYYHKRNNSLSTTKTELYYAANIKNLSERIDFLNTHPTENESSIEYISKRLNYLLWEYKQLLKATQDDEKGKELQKKFLMSLKYAVDKFEGKEKLIKYIPNERKRKFSLILRGDVLPLIGENGRIAFGLKERMYMEYAKNNVGIVGYWFATNYGGVASYYSLYRQIERMGYAPFFIDKPIDKEGMDTFSRNFFKSIGAKVSEKHNADEMHKLNSIADIFVLGSDQVLTVRSIKTNGKYFLLEFTDDNKKKIAYSASCGGNSLDSDEKTVAYAKKMLSRFIDVSVREYSAVDIVKNKLGINAQFAIDPIFFTSAPEYKELAKTASLSADENYMLAYILDPDEDKKRCIIEISEHLNLNKKIALDGRKFTYEKNNGLMDMPEATLPQLDFPQWLHYFSNASFVFTDSFHGASMAIIMNKPFIMYANYKRGFPRFETLAKLFDVSERMIKKSDELNYDTLTKNVDFEKLNSIILHEKEKGVQRLKRDMETPSNELPSLLLPPDITQKLDMSSCTGCGACAEICPTNAIGIKPNERGFMNPVVNKEKCVYCGKCTKRCIALNPEYKNNSEPKCYAVMANDEVRKVSSSGGMFTLAAEYVLSLGGYICGAAFNRKFEVEHIVIDKLEELDRLRGSKYIQSQAGKIYPKIKELLEQDKYVLFTGMPCQVAGLYSYLGKEYKKLYTIDLLCHGITSKKVFDKYRTEVLEKGKRQLTDIKFKAKEPWGWHAGVNADFSDGTHYAEPLERDPYFIAYLNSISKNSACGTCPVNRLPRQGDLTIGDFWKVTKFDPALRDEKGTSVVLVNNSVGEELLQKSREKAILTKEVPLEYAVAGNHCIEHPYALNKNHDLFFKYFDDLPFDALAVGCRDNRLYKQQHIKFLKSVPEEDIEYYHLAKYAAKNSNGRKIVTWVRSKKFERILKKYFDCDVDFGISQRKEKLVEGVIEDFNFLKGQKDKYYLVVFDRVYDSELYALLQKFGYTEIKDFLFRWHRPIVLENLDLSKGNYFDDYGNTIEGFNATVGKIVLRGCNNHIVLGRNLTTAGNLSIEMYSNGYVEIGDNIRFWEANKIEMRGYEGFSSLTIGGDCRFLNSLFKLYGDPNKSSIQIGNGGTFESNLDLHANSGKKLIVGKDCMFSHNVHLWAGDGHSVFDVKTSKNVNSVYENLPPEKNQLVIGNHVWVAYGAFIMHGTNIADGSIVGAQSVVKGIFPNNCSIAGNPAKVVRKDCAWARDMQTDDISHCGLDYVSLTKQE